MFVDCYLVFTFSYRVQRPTRSKGRSGYACMFVVLMYGVLTNSCVNS